jgi:hypothetical protein
LCCADTYSQPYADSNTYPNFHTHAYSIPYRDANTDTDTQSYAYPYSDP